MRWKTSRGCCAWTSCRADPSGRLMKDASPSLRQREGFGIIRIRCAPCRETRVAGIRQGPQGRCRMPRPDRAGLLPVLITDRDHEIEVRHVGPTRSCQAFRIGASALQFMRLQQADDFRPDFPRRIGAGGKGLKAAVPLLIDDGLGHDRACRVAGAQKENVVGVRSRMTFRPACSQSAHMERYPSLKTPRMRKPTFWI